MMDCLISFPLWDALVLALPPLYYYKYQSSLAIEWQVESLVLHSINLVFLSSTSWLGASCVRLHLYCTRLSTSVTIVQGLTASAVT
jgi:hypothetical protein